MYRVIKVSGSYYAVKIDMNDEEGELGQMNQLVREGTTCILVEDLEDLKDVEDYIDPDEVTIVDRSKP